MKRLRWLGRILLGLARELSDENAYRRHLAAHHRQHSAEEWRRFSEAHLRAKYSRAKCCGVALAVALSLSTAGLPPNPPFRCSPAHGSPSSSPLLPRFPKGGRTGVVGTATTDRVPPGQIG
jgi:hypothetical protein